MKDLILRIGVENPIAPTGMPIYLASLIQNTTDRDLDISELRAEPTFSLRVTDSSGREVPQTDRYRNFAAVSARYTSVPANGSTLDRLNLLDYCQCSEPGSYEVTLRHVVKSSRESDEVVTDSAAFRIVSPASTDVGSAPAASFRSIPALFPSGQVATLGLPELPQRISISLHEPVLASLKLRNIASQPFRLEIGEYAESGYRVAARLPSGQMIQSGSPREMVSFGVYYDLNLQPGVTEDHTILLNRWVDFSQEGDYTIAVFVPESAAPAMFDVNVRPRDSQVLEPTAARLVSTFNGLPRATALTALALMRDEIALERIQQITDPYTMTEALAVMDTPESASALVRIASGPKNTASDYAQKRLGRMLAATRDPVVQSIIESVQPIAIK